eukprot:CAMPEP_0177621694 /NCGR_PEP_ID=MMETSP0419_2-20121207/27730_1 /TAXON_ID=582737 /ORGANISM="Tetraselmis sp., Strain GSL018" /LENGTH=871 /DNA_ID=CAMNT_0019121645 /DNA_START=292 /DNA_END=2905 /DNA_ORIENTATION=+
MRRKEAKEHHGTALKLLKGGGVSNQKKAEKLLKYAVAAWPDNSRFQRMLGTCISHHQGDHEKGMSYFNSACELQPRTAANFTARGRCWTAMGEMDAALEDFNVAVALQEENPKHGKYRLARAVVCHRMELNEQAVKDYSYALENIREHIDVFAVLCNRGECFRKLGDIEASLKDLQTAQYMKMSYACQMSLGCSLLECDDHRGARAAFEQAERLDPYSAAAVNNLGLVCHHQAMMASEEFLAKQQRIVAIPEEEAERAAGGGAGGVSPAADAEGEKGRPGGSGWIDGDENDSDVDLSSPTMTPRSFQSAEQAEEVGDLLDNDSMSSSTVLSSMLFKPATVQGAAARQHLDRAITAYNSAIRVQQQGKGSAGEDEARSSSRAYRGKGCLYTDRVLLVVSDLREAGTPVIDSSMLKPGEIYFNRGKANLAARDFETALKDFDIALQYNTDNPEFPYYRGLVFEVMGNHEAARTWFNQALLRRTEYFPALLHAALVLHSTKMYKESIKRFEIALMIHPDRADVKEARGRVLQDMDNHAEALPALHDALKTLPAKETKQVMEARSRIYYAIAQSCLALRITNDAITALEKSQQLGQGGWMIDNLKGLLCKSQGDFKSALKLLTKAVRGNYGEPRMFFDRAILLTELDRHEDAVRDLTRALNRRKDCPALLHYRGKSYLQLNRYTLAAEDFLLATQKMDGEALVVPDGLWYGERFVTGDSRSPDITGDLWYSLGVCLAGKYSNQDACSAFRRAVQSCPGNPAYVHEYAKALQAVGRYEEGIKYFENVIRVQPNNSHALFRKALAHHSLKEYDRAVELFEDAKRFDPTNPRVVVDYNALDGVHVIELCRPGSERTDTGRTEEALRTLKVEDSWEDTR